MIVQDELEAMCAPPLSATEYRRLWLDAENELGLVAETLADALGWQRTPTDPLPNALELAEVAAGRLASVTTRPTRRRKRNCNHTRHGELFSVS